MQCAFRCFVADVPLFIIWLFLETGKFRNLNTPKIPLSYSNVRSVFTREERYEQTKKTIQSIKEKIPNCKIMIVECTDFTKVEKEYFEKECDYVLNLWDRKE